MAQPFMKAMDHFELDSRFSNEQGLSQKYQDMQVSNVSYEEMQPFQCEL